MMIKADNTLTEGTNQTNENSYLDSNEPNISLVIGDISGDGVAFDVEHITPE